MAEPFRKVVLAKAQHYRDAYIAGNPDVHERGQNHGKMIDHWLKFCGLDNPQNGDGYPYCCAYGMTCVGEALGFGTSLSLSDTHKQMRAMGLLPTASCEEAMEYAKQCKVWEPVGYPDPSIGWIVLFAFGKHPTVADHFAFIKSRIGVRRMTGLNTLEANTLPNNDGDQRNPINGGIFDKQRGLRKVLGYIRVP